jgi:hypothetical protein
MANNEPDWLELSSQEDMPTQALPGHHWERNKGVGWSQVEDNAAPETERKIPDEVAYLKDIQIKNAPADTRSDGPTKTMKMPTRPGQQSMVTMDAVKAAGFDNLRDYLNAQQGLVRRKEAPVAYKEMSLANSLKSKPKYAKGGKINLDACGVSTHTPSKKKANW